MYTKQWFHSLWVSIHTELNLILPCNECTSYHRMEIHPDVGCGKREMVTTSCTEMSSCLPQCRFTQCVLGTFQLNEYKDNNREQPRILQNVTKCYVHISGFTFRVTAFFITVLLPPLQDIFSFLFLHTKILPFL